MSPQHFLGFILSHLGPFVLVLGVLIFVHELGHFVTAKALGVRVLRFSLGMGPRLFGFRATTSGTSAWRKISLFGNRLACNFGLISLTRLIRRSFAT